MRRSSLSFPFFLLMTLLRPSWCGEILLERFEQDNLASWTSRSSEPDPDNGWKATHGLLIQDTAHNRAYPGNLLVLPDVLDLSTVEFPIDLYFDVLPDDYQDNEDVWFGICLLVNPARPFNGEVVIVLRDQRKWRRAGIHVAVAGRGWVTGPSNYPYLAGGWSRVRIQLDDYCPERSLRVRAKAWPHGSEEPPDWMTEAKVSGLGVNWRAKGIGVLCDSVRAPKTSSPRASFDDLLISAEGVPRSLLEAPLGAPSVDLPDPIYLQLGSVFEDDFSPSGRPRAWKYKWNEDEVIEPGLPGMEDAYALKVGDTYGFDCAYIDWATATNQLVEARIYVPADGRSRFSRMGIFAKARTPSFRDQANTCALLTADSGDGSVRAMFYRDKKYFKAALLDPQRQRLGQGWYTFKISALDNRFDFFVDGRIVATSVNNDCAGGFLAGIYNDAQGSNENLNYTVADAFRLVVFPEETGTFEGLRYLLKGRQKVWRSLVRLGLVEEAARYKSSAAAVLESFMAKHPTSPMKQAADEQLAIWQGLTPQTEETARSVGQEGFENIDELLALEPVIREFLLCSDLDVRESKRLKRPEGEVQQIMKLQSMVRNHLENAVLTSGETYRKALPKDEPFAFLLGAAQVVSRLGWTDLGRELLNMTAQSSDPGQRQEASLGIARLMVEEGENAQARELYERLASESPATSPFLDAIYLDWAELETRRRQYGGAVNIHQTFLDQYPDHGSVPLIERSLGELRLQMAKDYYEQAEDQKVLEAVARIPVQGATDEIGYEALFVRGLAELRLEDYDAASRSFRRLSQDAPRAELTSNALFLLGYTAVFQNDYATARQSFERFIQEYPDSAKVEEARLFLEKVKGLEGGER